jgi:RecB family exonuclease
MNVALPCATLRSLRPRSHLQVTPAEPNILAAQIIGRDYLSYSAVRTYQTCPLRFYFQYVLGLTPAFTPATLIFGAAVHAAIEKHFRVHLEGLPAADLEDLVGTYDLTWTSEVSSPVFFSRKESAASVRDLAAQMLKAFQTSEVAKDPGIVLDLEEEFRGPVVPRCPDILGRLDLLALKANASRITDFKTSRSSWHSAKVQESLSQQLLYSELVRPVAASFDNVPVEIEWVVLTKGRKPKIERHTAKPDLQQVRWTKLMVRQIWRAISTGQFFPTPSATICSSCPYRSPCAKWEG